MKEALVELAGLRAISVGEPDAARVVVVLLHGFAMEPGDLSPFAHSIGVPAWFLFPEAPSLAIGMPRGRAWWYINPVLRAEALARGPRDFAEQHPPDLPAARARLSGFLEALAPAAGARPLVLAGFSQGGMVLSDTLLRGLAPPPAGLALLSSSRITYDEWQPLLESRPLLDRPVLVSHGHADPDLAFSAGEALRDCYIAAGARVEWAPFDHGHEIPLVVWRRLRKFLLSLLDP
jgi:phospholipase/carboxylesterase